MTAMTGSQPAVSIAAGRPAGAVTDSADSHVAGILSVIRPLPARHLGLGETDGAVLAEDIRACAGGSVRCGGCGARPGELLLAAWTRLGAPQLGLLAAAGQASVLVRLRPRLTVLSAGNELAEPGEALIPGRSWESNSLMLAAAAAAQAGCAARRHRLIKDDQDDVLAAVQEALPGTDLLVTSGGISMGGEHDAIKAALRKLGSVTFRKVAMQPGMPQGFGTAGLAGTPIITLSGNPVSAFVSFRLFVLPAVRALQGLGPEKPSRAILAAPLKSPAAKRSFICGVLDLGHGAVMPAPAHSTHQLTALARSNALIIVSEQVTALSEGDAAEVLGPQP